ncbi:hypothetical protein [Thioflexithrix psekupsensis]|uniref:Uncharacterized protein n=1 Tax=Thioflexithrix psekupsensis TaxID=1570016 RepID=A0A251X8D4_9GAMM|nr:hypothetical protein [Thioflexithrix psekupsensis]OUD14190.1 hypothetical protein TPSD3_07620 [Thioflexithrix psekupsensis]
MSVTTERMSQVSPALRHEFDLHDEDDHYLSPQTEQEEQDYLALKVAQEVEDEVIELEIEHRQLQVAFEKQTVAYEAALALVRQGELDNTDACEWSERRAQLTQQMQDLRRKIRVKEKVLEQIKESIKTARYRIVNPVAMRNVHFF